MPSVSARMRMPRAGLEPAVRFLARGLLIPCVYQFRHLGTIHTRRVPAQPGGARRVASPGQVLWIASGQAVFERVSRNLPEARCAGEHCPDHRARLPYSKIETLALESFADLVGLYQVRVACRRAELPPLVPYGFRGLDNDSRSLRRLNRVEPGLSDGWINRGVYIRMVMEHDTESLNRRPMATQFLGLLFDVPEQPGPQVIGGLRTLRCPGVHHFPHVVAQLYTSGLHVCFALL